MHHEFRCIAALALTSSCAGQAQFIPLGSLSGQPAHALGINADGTVVVGSAGPFLARFPVRWTVNPQPSVSAIGLPAGFDTGIAVYVSDDGDALVGWRQQGLAITPFRWNNPGPTVALPVPAGWTNVRANAISPDGGFAVGTASPTFGVSRAIRWVGVQQPELLEMLPLATESGGRDADGAGAIYGVMAIAGVNYMVRWSPSGTGVTVLAGLPTGGPASGPVATPMRVSLDGTRIAGYTEELGTVPVVGHPWLWTRAGFTPIPNLPGATRCIPAGLAEDGSMVVGSCEYGLTGPAAGFVWTPGGGTREISQVLSALGASFAGWSVNGVGMSRDGRSLIGGGTNPAGQSESWLARLPEFCYADCTFDGLLTIADFGCFQALFVAGNPHADCTGNGQLSIADFGCFQTAFAAGCP